MTVDGAEVFESELFEHHAAMKSRFDAFLNLEKQSFGGVTQHGYLVQHVNHLGFHT